MERKELCIRLTITFVLGFLYLVPGCLSECPSGTGSYYNMEANQWVCCFDITCSKGHQAFPCEIGNFTSSCRKCDDDHFNDRPVSLRDKTRNKCRRRKQCHYFLIRGDEATDATCNCPEKWHHLEDQTMCLPNVDCEKGFGQSDTGHCKRCIHGETFSNETNNRQRCMPVRRCLDEYRCTIREANISADAICTRDVISDIHNCPKPGEFPSTTGSPSSSSEANSRKPEPDKKTKTGHKERDHPRTTPEIDHNSLAYRVVVCLLVIAVVVMIVVFTAKTCRKERYKMHLPIAEHLEHADLANRRQENEKVYVVIREYLVDEKCQHWDLIGENLLGEKLAGIMSDINVAPDDREKMHTVLDRWKESCLSEGPFIRPLFDAMYSPERNWCIPFAPLRSRIISSCTLPIPREHNISCLRRLCRMEWVENLPGCGRRLASYENEGRSDGQESLPPSANNSQYHLVSNNVV